MLARALASGDGGSDAPLRFLRRAYLGGDPVLCTPPTLGNAFLFNANPLAARLCDIARRSMMNLDVADRTHVLRNDADPFEASEALRALLPPGKVPKCCGGDLSLGPEGSCLGDGIPRSPALGDANALARWYDGLRTGPPQLSSDARLSIRRTGGAEEKLPRPMNA